MQLMRTLSGVLTLTLLTPGCVSGGQFFFNECGLLGIVCGAGVEAIAAVAGVKPRTARVPRSSSPSGPINPYAAWTNLHHVGEATAAKAFPAGDLYLALQSVSSYGGDKRAWLVVNLKKANADGLLSYSAHMNVNCAAKGIAVLEEIWTDERDGGGEPIERAIHDPMVRVERPDPLLVEAGKVVCMPATATL